MRIRRVIALVGATGVVLATGAAPAIAVDGPGATPVDGRTHGQVQFYVQLDDDIPLDEPEGYRCVGSLIDEEWVLISRHCVEQTGATEDNSGVLVGSPRFGEGALRGIDEIIPDDDTDVALLQLEDDAPDDAEVVAYSDEELEVGEQVRTYGWGSFSPPPPQPVLHRAIQQVTSLTDPGAPGWGNRVSAAGLGQGRTAPGDSGAGVFAPSVEEDVVFAVHSSERGDNRDTSLSVPTSDVADWIEDVSDVGPVDD